MTTKTMLGYAVFALAVPLSAQSLTPTEGLWKWTWKWAGEPSRTEVKYVRPIEIADSVSTPAVRTLFEVLATPDSNSQVERYGVVAVGTDQVFVSFRKGIGSEQAGLFVGRAKTVVKGLITEIELTSVGSPPSTTAVAVFIADVSGDR